MLNLEPTDTKLKITVQNFKCDRLRHKSQNTDISENKYSNDDEGIVKTSYSTIIAYNTVSSQFVIKVINTSNSLVTK